MLPDDIFPFLIAVVIMLIPIVAILTKHQQKMAEILHSRRGDQGGEVETLRGEIRELKNLLLQQSIALDDVKRGERTSDTQDDVRNRIVGGIG